ncbi:MAG: hypothetical protein H0U23_04835 [Blastocatellia bacterium]|nr:hypothetical protein [Blastocatellia bacterium]
MGVNGFLTSYGVLLLGKCKPGKSRFKDFLINNTSLFLTSLSSLSTLSLYLTLSLVSQDLIPKSFKIKYDKDTPFLGRANEQSENEKLRNQMVAL